MRAYRRRRYRRPREPRQPGPEPAGGARRAAAAAQRHPGRGADGAEPAGVVGVAGRLRRHFDDELLTRVGNQYRLTPLAVQLKDRVRVALSGVERVFAAQADFDPAVLDARVLACW